MRKRRLVLKRVELPPQGMLVELGQAVAQAGRRSAQRPRADATLMSADTTYEDNVLAGPVLPGLPGAREQFGQLIRSATRGRHQISQFAMPSAGLLRRGQLQVPQLFCVEAVPSNDSQDLGVA